MITGPERSTMMGTAAVWVWAIVAAGGLLALLSLILAITLGLMLNAPIIPAPDPDDTPPPGRASEFSGRRTGPGRPGRGQKGHRTGGYGRTFSRVASAPVRPGGRRSGTGGAAAPAWNPLARRPLPDP